MQIGSSTTPAMGTQGQIESTHAGNLRAEEQPPTTSAATRSSAATEGYVPSTPSTANKDYFDLVQQIFEVNYRRYLEERYAPSGPNYLNTGIPGPLDFAYPGYMVSPYGVTNPGLICSPSANFSPMSVGYLGYVSTYQPNYYITSPSPSYGTGYLMGDDMA